MKLLTIALGVLLLFGPALLRGESYYPPEEYIHDREPPPPEPPGTFEPGPDHPGGHRAHRGRYGMILFKQFRREVRAMGEEIRENFGLIELLEKDLEELEPGPAADETRRRLNQLKRRQAELRLSLARKKVDFALRARQAAEERYQESLEELAQVSEIVAEEYPDLADLPPAE